MTGRLVSSSQPDHSKTWWKQTIIRLATTALVTAFAVVAAYFGTISDLKLALAEKADRTTAERIELRLAQIEVLLSDHLVSRDEFFKLRDELRVRLTRIESEINH